MSRVLYQHEPCLANKQQLAELIELLGQYNSIGITRVENISSKTIQRLRHALRGEAVLKLAKNTLMHLALKAAAKKNKGLAQLLDYIKGSCAFILTNSNVFKIANFLEKNKIPTAAKEGQIAPKDVIVAARDTGFAPGPVIGELQAIGLKTRIEAGTVKILEDAVVCPEGERVSRTVANVLGRLGIEPFDAGLSIEVIFSEGSLIKHEELILDFDEQMANLLKAHQNAFGLSLAIVFPIEENIAPLIQKSHRQALSLALATNFITPETVGNMLVKTQLEAIALARSVMAKDPNALPPDLLSAVQSTTSTVVQEKTEKAASATTDIAEEEDEEPDSLFG